MPLPDYMSNPLFHMGLGLMSVPNQSYAPGAVSWGPGIQRGLLGYQQSLLYQDRAEEQAQRQELQKRKLEWEMQRQQQAQQDAAAQAQAREQWLASQDPAMQSFGAAFPGQLGKIAAQQFESPEIEGEAGYKAWLQANGLQPSPGSYEQYLRLRASIDPKAKASQITNVLGGGYKPVTQPGKQAADLAFFQKERDARAAAGEDTALYDTTIAKLQQAQSTQTPMGAEESRTLGRLQIVNKTVDRFNALADEAPEDTGPFAARAEGLQGLLGKESKAFAEMKAMEATMMTQLGTALSGAAIPPSEWPLYQAQIPLVTDPPQRRKAKAENFKRLMKDLESQAARRRGEGNTGGRFVYDAESGELIEK